ncbi:MAG: LysM peptidoglycan-binding domain-containing protein [Sedimentisphaerales bacterium]|nr:LysM peptidoglycan-binding domain-containing protein [Sedimentisphaerales bacterium]
MGKDFRIGLIGGLVLVIAALIWVATRPSLSPQARLLRTPQNASREASSPSGTIARPPRESQPARENLLPDLVPAEPATSRVPSPGSIESLPSVTTGANVPDLTVYEQAEKIRTTKFHIVQKDETLSSISQQYYGTPNRWQKILQANRDVIKDANKITPGTKLTIPD